VIAVDVLLVLAAVVVIPLALPLLLDDVDVRRWVVAGALTAPALALPRHSVGAVALALPWAGLAAGTAAVHGLRWLRDGRRSWALVVVAVPVALAFVAFAAGSLVASRAGVTVGHLVEPIVELTAVHYSYAGFTATTLGRRALLATGTRPAATALVLLLVAPPAVAAGFFTRLAVFQVGGALLLTTATWTLAVVTLRHADRNALLVVSSLAVLLPMVLAVSWAAAQFWDVPALTIPQMARTHGVANALGFALCGTLGWRAVAARS
jgi:hypothetical protein